MYVPGGTAVLPSTALMLCTPAGLAGCSTIVLATPPRPDGSITPVRHQIPALPRAYTWQGEAVAYANIGQIEYRAPTHSMLYVVRWHPQQPSAYVFMDLGFNRHVGTNATAAEHHLCCG